MGRSDSQEGSLARRTADRRKEEQLVALDEQLRKYLVVFHVDEEPPSSSVRTANLNGRIAVLYRRKNGSIFCNL